VTFAPNNLTQVPDPGPRRYGLLSVARVLPMSPRVRVAGATYDPDGCGTPRGYAADCVGSPGTKTFDTNVGEEALLPFVVYASLVCGSAGYPPEYLEAKVRRKLEAVEQSGVEQALWSGAISGVALGNTPTFQNGAAIGGNPTILTATATLKAGLAALEDFAALNYGYQPVIHATAGISAHLASNRLIDDRDTAVSRTFMGTPVSLGAYPGTSPAGVAAGAGAGWLFITGQVTVWREEEIFVAPARQTLNRSTNQYQLIAERTWAASYDCFVAAVNVTTL
jgi:hypothetical protein